jgi:hypothetical protein
VRLPVVEEVFQGLAVGRGHEDFHPMERWVG